eukprot:scaffold316_cov352-Pavlova_lutheri.AAC.15
MGNLDVKRCEHTHHHQAKEELNERHDQQKSLGIDGLAQGVSVPVPHPQGHEKLDQSHGGKCNGKRACRLNITPVVGPPNIPVKFLYISRATIARIATKQAREVIYEAVQSVLKLGPYSRLWFRALRIPRLPHFFPVVDPRAIVVDADADGNALEVLLWPSGRPRFGAPAHVPQSCVTDGDHVRLASHVHPVVPSDGHGGEQQHGQAERDVHQDPEPSAASHPAPSSTRPASLFTAKSSSERPCASAARSSPSLSTSVSVVIVNNHGPATDPPSRVGRRVPETGD